MSFWTFNEALDLFLWSVYSNSKIIVYFDFSPQILNFEPVIFEDKYLC